MSRLWGRTVVAVDLIIMLTIAWPRQWSCGSKRHGRSLSGQRAGDAGGAGSPAGGFSAPPSNQFPMML